MKVECLSIRYKVRYEHMLQEVNFLSRVNSSKQKMQGFNKYNLSFPASLTSAQQLFVSPKGCLEALERMCKCNVFLWGGAQYSARGAKVSWHILFVHQNQQAVWG